MSRGKSFDHKKKGHPGKLPDNAQVEGKDYSHPMKDVADFATYEAYKNRVRDEEE